MANKKTEYFTFEKPKYHTLVKSEADALFHVRLSLVQEVVGPFDEELDAKEWAEAHSHQPGQVWTVVEPGKLEVGTKIRNKPVGCAILISDTDGKHFCLTCNK